MANNILKKSWLIGFLSRLSMVIPVMSRVCCHWSAGWSSKDNIGQHGTMLRQTWSCVSWTALPFWRLSDMRFKQIYFTWIHRLLKYDLTMCIMIQNNRQSVSSNNSKSFLVEMILPGRLRNTPILEIRHACNARYCMINVGRQAGRAKLLQGKVGPWPHDFFAPGTSGVPHGGPCH